VDTAGHTWSADTGYNTGIAYTFATTVSGTNDPTLYKTSRYFTPSQPPLTYTFSVPNGNYTVRLHLSETYAGTQGVGKRVFDIDIQSVRAFEDVDIFALAGANKAHVLEKSATVTNGQIKIGFVRQVENPKINAIEILPAGSTPETQPPTAPGSLTFSSVTSTSLTVNWTAATDNVGVTGYRISRNGAVVNTVSGLSFNDTGLSPSTSYSYSVVALDAAGNVSPASSGTIATIAGGTPSTLIRVNAGGPAYVDTLGLTWSADTGFNTGKAYTSTSTIPVSGTTAPTLFKTERYEQPTDPRLVYTFSVPNGSYRVRLHFAEVYAATKGVGKRIFDIDIQSLRAFEDVDIFSRAGGGDKAIVLEHNATVTSGQLAIGFIRQVENPKINAIEIISVP
jgi:chitodextrinase